MVMENLTRVLPKASNLQYNESPKASEVQSGNTRKFQVFIDRNCWKHFKAPNIQFDAFENDESVSSLVVGRSKPQKRIEKCEHTRFESSYDNLKGLSETYSSSNYGKQRLRAVRDNNVNGDNYLMLKMRNKSPSTKRTENSEKIFTVNSKSKEQLMAKYKALPGLFTNNLSLKSRYQTAAMHHRKHQKDLEVTRTLENNHPFMVR